MRRKIVAGREEETIRSAVVREKGRSLTAWDAHSVKDEVLLEQDHVERISPVPRIVLDDSVSVNLTDRQGEARSAPVFGPVRPADRHRQQARAGVKITDLDPDVEADDGPTSDPS